MKKTIKYLLLLIVMTVALTGCVKYNSTMTINKDKSMDYSIIYAVDTSMLGNESLLTDENKANLESSGFRIEDYTEDSMKGFKITKHFNNIDDISSTNSVNYDLSGVLNNKSTDVKIFNVKKGFLKSTYTAKFKFDSTESDLNSTSLNETSEEQTADTTLDTTTTDTITDTDTSETSDSLDNLSSMSANMDLSFNVNLPYAAKSSNATKKENDNKKLTWELASDSNAQNIEFSFEMYNMKNVYIVLGGGSFVLVILLIGAVYTIKSGKKNKPNTTDPIPNTTENTNESVNVIPTTENTNDVSEPTVTAENNSFEFFGDPTVGSIDNTQNTVDSEQITDSNESNTTAEDDLSVNSASVFEGDTSQAIDTGVEQQNEVAESDVAENESQNEVVESDVAETDIPSGEETLNNTETSDLSDPNNVEETEPKTENTDN